MKKNPAILFFFLTVSLLSGGCRETVEEDLRSPFIKPIDPNTQASQLSRALTIDGTNQAGDMPNGTPSTNLRIVAYSGSALVSNDNILFIPFSFESTHPLAKAYLQIEGADNFWEIPIGAEGSNHAIQVGIPVNVLSGNFQINYQLQDQSNNQSQVINLSVEVADPIACNPTGFPRVEGNDGITVRTYLLEGNTPHSINIEYNMYTVPDRIDIRYNNQWVYSSGNLLSSGEAPVFKRCDEVVPGDGFRGGRGVFQLDFDPKLSRKVDIYVSGCLDGGTRWWFEVDCPENNLPAPLPEKWYAQLPDCPCTYLEAIQASAEEDPLGEWLICGTSENLHDFHFGAEFEARWVPKAFGGYGQQCTYDSEGQLITAGIAAGSPDKVSPGICSFPASLGNAIQVVDHWNADVRPWGNGYFSISCIRYLNYWPANDGNCSERNPIYDIRAHQYLIEMFGNMSCEDATELIQVLDNPAYTNSMALRTFIKHGIVPSGISKATMIAWIDDVTEKMDSPSEVVLQARKNLQ